MSRRTIGGVTIAVLAVGLCSAPASRGDDDPQPKKPSLDDVVKGWSPEVKGAKATKTGTVISDGNAPRVAAHLFEVSDASYEDVWNHYAAKCGTKERFDKKVFRGNLWQGAKGKPSYHIVERETRPGERVTVFTYRTTGHTVSVSIQPNVDRGTILTALTVVTDE